MNTTDKLKWLIEHSKNSVSVSVNNHRDYYESVKDYLRDKFASDEIEQEIRDKMVELNIVVEVQAYPRTSISFYVSYHYDLESALDEIIACYKEDGIE